MGPTRPPPRVTAASDDSFVVGRAFARVLGAVVGTDRADRTLSAKLGLDYHLSKNWLFTFAYEYQQRLSSEGDESMSRNRVSIGAKLRF